MISNVSSQLVSSPLTVLTKNFALENGHIIIVLTVPKGMDKPYFDKNGIIWLKAGADKPRVNSKEELRRLFQISDQFPADELPTKKRVLISWINFVSVIFFVMFINKNSPSLLRN